MSRHPVILSANSIRNYDPAMAAKMVENLLLSGDSSAPAGGAYDLLGQIYLVAGDLLSARDSFLKDLKSYPNSHSTFLYMGLIEEINGDPTKAKAWYLRAPERSFDSSYKFNVRAACKEWQRKHRKPVSRIALLEQGLKPPPLFSRKHWWQFWKR